MACHLFVCAILGGRVTAEGEFNQDCRQATRCEVAALRQQLRFTEQQYARFTQHASLATDESAASAASDSSVVVTAVAPRWQHLR